jgi:hypothetical protein
MRTEEGDGGTGEGAIGRLKMKGFSGDDGLAALICKAYSVVSRTGFGDSDKFARWTRSIGV